MYLVSLINGSMHVAPAAVSNVECSNFWLILKEETKDMVVPFAFPVPRHADAAQSPGSNVASDHRWIRIFQTFQKMYHIDSVPKYVSVTSLEVCSETISHCVCGDQNRYFKPKHDVSRTLT